MKGIKFTDAQKAFNRKLRSECLNTHWFMNLDDARSSLEAWRRDYNEVLPHSAIGNKTPVSLIKCPDQALPP